MVKFTDRYFYLPAHALIISNRKRRLNLLFLLVLENKNRLIAEAIFVFLTRHFTNSEFHKIAWHVGVRLREVDFLN